MKSACHPHALSLSALAELAHSLLPTIYRLISTYLIVCCFVLLVCATSTVDSNAGLMAAIPGVHPLGIGSVLFMLLLAAMLLALLFRFMNDALFALFGLALFAISWRLDVLEGTASVAIFMPFCGYFWMRAKAQPPLRAVARLVASIIALQFVRLSVDGSPGSADGVSRHVTVWTAWIWTLLGAVFTVNLALAWWHLRRASTPERH